MEELHWRAGMIHTRGGTQLWVTCHVPPKRPYFFRSLSPKDHFYQLSPNDPLFLTNSLSPKDPDTSLSLRDPLFSHLIVKEVTIFGKKIWFFEKLMKCWRNFWPFRPWKPLFFWCISLKDPLFLCALSLKDPLFLMQFVTERPLHLRCLVALVRHFHMWVPPPPRYTGQAGQLEHWRGYILQPPSIYDSAHFGSLNKCCSVPEAVRAEAYYV